VECRGEGGVPTYVENGAAMASASEIVEQATRTLQNTHPALRHLSVQGNEDSLVISGTVTCYYHKQLAQEALRQFRGSLLLVNHVRVNSN
jgi:hypothetical protein